MRTTYRSFYVGPRVIGSDYRYHYHASAKTMMAMGRAFAAAMLELRGEKPAPPR